MGIITGYICLICLIILLAKFIARKLHLTKLNGRLMKIHKYAAGYIYAKVKVVVEDHSIKRISILEHNHERGAAAESIIETMVKKQKVDVDAVTGATNSSLVIKRACVNALLQ